MRAPTGCTERPPQQPDQLIAQRLELHATPDCLRVLLGHGDGGVETQKIGQGEQMDMQGVTLQPFATVEQPAQFFVPSVARGLWLVTRGHSGR